MKLGVVFLLLAACACVQVKWIAGAGATGIGLNYAANRVFESSAEGFVKLVKSQGIGKVRLHDADSAMLRALGGGWTEEDGESSQIEVIVGVGNEEVIDIGVSWASARRWVARNVIPYYPSTNIIAIAVGSEILTSGKQEDEDHKNLAPFLVPAMRNIHSALVEQGLEKKIKVSAPQSAKVLSRVFPPSAAAFDEQLTEVVSPLLDFLEASGSYFMLNLYPADFYHGAMADKFPLAASTGNGMKDPGTGLKYSNLFDVVVDATSLAMATLDRNHPHRLGVVVTGTGWSRPGDSIISSSASSVYNANLVTRILGESGTPLNPGTVIDTYMDGEGGVSFSSHQRKASDAGPFSSRRLLSSDPSARGIVPDKSSRRRRLANKSWCVAKNGGSTDALQSALDWACGPGGADCSPVQVGQRCFLPNNIQAHASYAFNSYYQKRNWAADSCNFGGLAQTTTQDPSTTSCLYSSNTDASGSPSTPTGTIVPPNESKAVCTRLCWNRSLIIITTIALVFLLERSKLFDSKF